MGALKPFVGAFNFRIEFFGTNINTKSGSTRFRFTTVPAQTVPVSRYIGSHACPLPLRPRPSEGAPLTNVHKLGLDEIQAEQISAPLGDIQTYVDELVAVGQHPVVPQVRRPGPAAGVRAGASVRWRGAPVEAPQSAAPPR